MAWVRVRAHKRGFPKLRGGRRRKRRKANWAGYTREPGKQWAAAAKKARKRRKKRR